MQGGRGGAHRQETAYNGGGERLGWRAELWPVSLDISSLDVPRCTCECAGERSPAETELPFTKGHLALSNSGPHSIQDAVAGRTSCRPAGALPPAAGGVRA